MKSEPGNNSLTWRSRRPSNSTYLMWFMVPSIMCNLVVPWTNIASQTMILAGNLTVFSNMLAEIPHQTFGELSASIIEYCSGWFIWKNNLNQRNILFKIVSMLWIEIITGCSWTAPKASSSFLSSNFWLRKLTTNVSKKLSPADCLI